MTCCGREPCAGSPTRWVSVRSTSSYWVSLGHCPLPWEPREVLVPLAQALCVPCCRGVAELCLFPSLPALPVESIRKGKSLHRAGCVHPSAQGLVGACHQWELHSLLAWGGSFGCWLLHCISYCSPLPAKLQGPSCGSVSTYFCSNVKAACLSSACSLVRPSRAAS